MSQKLKKLNIVEDGFTLMEVLTTVAILLLLLGIFIVNFNRAGQKQLLLLSAEELANQIRTAQTSALAGQETVLADGTKIYSYGIYIDTSDNNNKYVRFADAPVIDNSNGYGSCSYGDQNFDPNEKCPLPQGEIDQELYSIELPSGIVWYPGQTSKNIVFRLPKRGAFIDGLASPAIEGDTVWNIIKLTNKLNDCKQVRVVPLSGQVSIEDCTNP